jgi:multiple sugar transport system permease protein
LTAPAGFTPSCALAYIVLIMVLCITNVYVKYLNKAKER